MAQVAVEELVAGLDGTEVRVVGMPERWAKQMVRGHAKLPVKIVPSEQERIVRKAHASTAHLENVQHRTTRLTLATRELETEVRVAGKDVVAVRPIRDEIRSRVKALLDDLVPAGQS